MISTNKLTARTKLAVGSAAAAALYLTPGLSEQANAGVVHQSTPITIAGGGDVVDWDIDGDTVADFTLETSGGFRSMQGGGRFINLVGSFEDAIQNLGPTTSSSIMDIGPTLPAGYYFGVSGPSVAFRTMISGNSNLGPDSIGFTDGVAGFIGFDFPGATGTQYGWASLTIDLSAGSLTINEWAYEDSGESIHLGQTVPEPSTLSGLALLACGAAGVRRRRKQNA